MRSGIIAVLGLALVGFGALWLRAADLPRREGGRRQQVS